LPLHRHDRRCVHSRLNRRSGIGPGPPRPELVPSLPFLPASTVYSAEQRSEDRCFRRPAGLLHPAAGHGVRQVSELLYCLLAARGRGVSAFRSLSRWRRPFEAFPSPAAVHLVTTGPSEEGAFLRRRPVFTEWHSLSSFGSARLVPCCHGDKAHVPDLRALLHRRVRCRTSTFPHWPARCSHGLWIDSFRCLPRTWRRPVVRQVVSPRSVPTPPGVQRHPRVARKARFSACLAPREPMLVPTRRSAPAGLARWQPEDCCASRPPERYPW